MLLAAAGRAGTPSPEAHGMSEALSPQEGRARCSHGGDRILLRLHPRRARPWRRARGVGDRHTQPVPALISARIRPLQRTADCH